MTYEHAPRRLVRLPADGKVAGVCAGLAAYFEADVTLIRLVWVVLSIVPGGIVGGSSHTWSPGPSSRRGLARRFRAPAAGSSDR